MGLILAVLSETRRPVVTFARHRSKLVWAYLSVRSGDWAYGSRAWGFGLERGGAQASQDRSSAGLLTNSVGLKLGFLVVWIAFTLSSYCLDMVDLIVLAAGVSMLSALRLLFVSGIFGGVTNELSENEESEELMVASVSESVSEAVSYTHLTLPTIYSV